MSPDCAGPSCISESIKGLILPWCWEVAEVPDSVAMDSLG